MNDFHLNKGVPILDRNIDLVLQQIDMLFDTNPGEVLGDTTYGTRYGKYLYNLNISNEGIKQAVLSDIMKLDLMGYSPQVEVILLEGTQRDIAIIDIILKDEYNSYRRTYKIFDTYENL